MTFTIPLPPSGQNGTFNESWHAYWDSQSVPPGTFDERALSWGAVENGHYGTVSEVWKQYIDGLPPTIPDPPAAPSGMTATAVSDTQIDLAWADNSHNELSFRIERSPTGTGGWNVISTPPANTTTFSDTGRLPETTYYYRVYAVNTAGDSAASNTASATTQAVPTFPPTAPTGIEAVTAASDQINISWTDTSDNETGFRIERSLTGTGGWATVTTVAANVTSYFDTGLSDQTTYYYRVFAFNAEGDSPVGQVASATTSTAPQVPAAPSDLVATVLDDDQIDLTWSDNSDNETGFRVERSADGSTGWATVASLPPSGTPTAPSALTTTVVDDDQIDLEWLDNSDNETGFRVERSPDGSTGWTEIASLPPSA